MLLNIESDGRFFESFHLLVWLYVIVYNVLKVLIIL